MFLEPTTLTSAALVMTETVEKQYGIEAKPLLEELGLDPALMDKPGARYPTAKMRELWGLLAETTKDPCVGLAIGARVKPTTFHALGFAWLASNSIHEELQRLQRYFKVISSVPVDIRLIDTGTTYRFEMRDPEQWHSLANGSRNPDDVFVAQSLQSLADPRILFFVPMRTS